MLDTPVNLALALEQEPELALLVAQPPVAFERYFVDVTGSALAALLLSAYRDLQAYSDGWANNDEIEVHYRTGMTKAEQKAARKLLLSKNLIQQRGDQVRVDFEEIAKRVLCAARKRSPGNLESTSAGTFRHPSWLAH